MSQTIAAQLSAAIKKIATISETPRLEAELLLAQILNVSRVYLHTWPEREVNAAIVEKFSQNVTRRCQGEPLAYILGYKEFWSLELIVTPDTLIPRPETEMIVELVLEYLPKEETFSVVDLGTGSGAIALAIAKERPHWQVIAVDKFNEALQIAKLNANRHNIENVLFVQASWLQSFAAQKFHAIVSNPPYIAENDPHLSSSELKFEPQTALVAENQGFSAYQEIISQAPNCLMADGFLVLEHGKDQGKTVQELMRSHHFENIKQYYDLAGIDRVCSGKKQKLSL
jgi:release factor glutamine methyltransferase